MLYHLPTTFSLCDGVGRLLYEHQVIRMNPLLRTDPGCRSLLFANFVNAAGKTLQERHRNPIATAIIEKQFVLVHHPDDHEQRIKLGRVLEPCRPEIWKHEFDRTQGRREF